MCRRKSLKKPTHISSISDRIKNKYINWNALLIPLHLIMTVIDVSPGMV